MDWRRKWFVDFNAGKTQLVSFDQSNNTGTIDVKMDRSALEEKSCFKMLELTFSSKLGWSSYIISIAKTAYKKIGALIRSKVSFSWGCCVSLLIYHTPMYGIVKQATKSNMQECWSFAASLGRLAHRRNVASLNLVFSFGITLVDVRQNWRNWFPFLFPREVYSLFW